VVARSGAARACAVLCVRGLVRVCGVRPTHVRSNAQKAWPRHECDVAAALVVVTAHGRTMVRQAWRSGAAWLGQGKGMTLRGFRGARACAGKGKTTARSARAGGGGVLVLQACGDVPTAVRKGRGEITMAGLGK
jgi:hypothetical protein